MPFQGKHDEGHDQETHKVNKDPAEIAGSGFQCQYWFGLLNHIPNLGDCK